MPPPDPRGARQRAAEPGAPPLVTIITCTADQPFGFQLCERFMARQTIWNSARLQWLVIDDGLVPVAPTMGQTYVRRAREPGCTGAQSLARNLLTALPRVRGHYVVIAEHDDYYGPDHLERLVAQLAPARVLIAGDDIQRYYNVATRQWKVFKNRGAALCQTGFKRPLLPLFQRVVETCLAAGTYGIDGRLWAKMAPGDRALSHTATVVGIKGLPGRAGLGLGHRPTAAWTQDPTLQQLRHWIGDDVACYADLSWEPAPVVVSPVSESIRPLEPAEPPPVRLTPPRLEACYFGGGPSGQWTRLAQVLAASARKHLAGWNVQVRHIPVPDVAAPNQPAAYVANTYKLAHWTNVVECAADGDRLLLIDADTIILRALDDVWRLPAFDLAYTTRPGKYPINAGVLFVRVSPRTRTFFRAWCTENQQLLTNPIEHAEWRRRFGGLNQAALGAVLETAHQLRLRALPCREWNCEETSWLRFDATTRIVHVKSTLRNAAFHCAPAPRLGALVRLWHRAERSAGLPA